jgi:hypothetical protein
MPGCPIIRLEKHKSAASLMGAMGHHARTIPTANADPARLHDNQVLWGTDQPKEVARLVAERTDHLVKRKDAVRSVELFLGASDEFWEAGGDWVKLGRAHLAMLKREFGEQNIVGMGVHLDERRPHFWAVITPITPQGKLAASHWFDGPAKLAQLLDRAQPDFDPLGMERARRGVKATHVDMQTIHDANAGNPRAARKLARELARREKAAQEAAEEAETRAAAARAQAQAAQAGALVAKRNLQDMRGEIQAISEQREALAAEAARLKGLRARLGEIQEAIVDALQMLPLSVAEQIAKRFGLKTPSEGPDKAQAPPAPEKRATGPQIEPETPKQTDGNGAASRKFRPGK